MLHKILITFLLVAVVSAVRADTVQVNPDHPEQYTVQKGDTLWDIAGRFLTQPWRWPEIWKVNPQIENPHLIYPGDVVSLSYEAGSPVLTVDRDTGEGRVVSGREVKLSPSIRSYDHKDAIPTIPIDVIREFLSRPLVVGKGEIESWPYIVSSYDQHLVAGTGNEIYVRGLPADSDTDRYSIYRKGNAYESENKYQGSILGYEAIYVGEAVITEFGDPARAVVLRSEREVLNGDRLVAHSETDVETDFTPRAPESSVSGSIISATDVLSEIGQYKIVVLDVGKADGVQVGNVLGIYQSGDVVIDKIGSGKYVPVAGEGTNPISNVVGSAVKTKSAFDKTALVEYLGKPKAGGEQVRLPDTYAGVLMVFRTFEEVSYGLIMEAKSPIHLKDTVKNL